MSKANLVKQAFASANALNPSPQKKFQTNFKHNLIIKLELKPAKEQDLPIIIELLNDDILGKTRENPDNLTSYKTAFEEIQKSTNDFLFVTKCDDKISGTIHLTIMPSLTLQGKKRMNIEAVRIDSSLTSQGIGSWMIEQTIKFAKKHNVELIQLTTNKQRDKSLNFYKKLGFTNSHEGLKLKI